ncbi:hypothetical protein QZH41_009384 [Actinostola sp. cb2023]|nr:hypothetical protein QZH41_009384 [Actinostola sp. cb2023]
MKTMYEAEQMSKQKLQAEMDRLNGDYSKKVNDIEEHYYAIEHGLSEKDDTSSGITSVTPEYGSVISVIALDEARRASESHTNLTNDHILHILQDKMHKGMESLHHSSNAALHMIQDKVNQANLPSTMVDAKGAQQEALKRLQELQEKMVGGEKKGDQKLKEKRKARKAYAKSKKEKLFLAAKKMDDEGISTMVQVYDSLQDEIKFKTRHIDRLEKQMASVQTDVYDQQEEFERDREDYLDTIRKQEQMLKLQQQILDKIQPCIRRDCNYFNIDRIKAECVWDEESGKWNLPDLVVTKTTLPTPGGIMPGGSPQTRRKSPTRLQIGPQGHLMNGYSGMGYHEEPKEDRFLQHLSRNSHEELAANYFKPKRAEKLLSQNTRFDTIDRRETTSPVGPRQAGSFASAPPPRSFGSTQPPPQQDAHLSRPARLESLNMPTEKERKKKKKKQAHTDLAFERRREEPW